MTRFDCRYRFSSLAASSAAKRSSRPSCPPWRFGQNIITQARGKQCRSGICTNVRTGSLNIHLDYAERVQKVRGGVRSANWLARHGGSIVCLVVCKCSSLQRRDGLLFRLCRRALSAGFRTRFAGSRAELTARIHDLDPGDGRMVRVLPGGRTDIRNVDGTAVTPARRIDR
jgi:hypothetical protein